MATVIPASAGQDIQRGTEQLINMIMQAQQMQLMRDQLAGQQRAQGLEELLALIETGQPGASVAERPELHPALTRLFPEMDPTDPEGLGGRVFNPATFQETVDLMGVETLNRMFAEGELDETLTEAARVAIPALLAGEPRSAEELNTRRQQFKIYSNLIRDWKPNEREAHNMVRTVMGLDPTTVVEGLGTFETPVEAEIAARLSMHGLDYLFKQRSESMTAQNDLVLEFVEQLKDAGLSIPRRIAAQMMNLVHQGDTEGLQRFADAYSDSPAVLQALNHYISGARIAEEALFNKLSQLPGGEELFTTIQVLDRVAGALTPQEASKLYRNLLPQMAERGWPVASSEPGPIGRAWNWLSGGTPFRGGTPIQLPGGAVPQTGASALPGQIPPPETDSELGAASSNLSDMGQAVQDLVNGNVTLSELSRRFNRTQLKIIREAVELEKKKGKP